MVPCKSTAEEVSFEWSHHRISSTDSKVRTTHVCISDSESESFNWLLERGGRYTKVLSENISVKD